MATQYEVVVDLCQTLMLTIPNIGAVHNRMRYAKDEQGFLNLLKVSIGGVDQIRGWMITSPKQPRRRGPSIGVFETINLKVMGYMSSVDADATERTFSALTEVIADTLSAKIRLNDTQTVPPYIAENALTQVTQRGYARIAGVLCHYAELEVAVTVYKSIAYS